MGLREVAPRTARSPILLLEMVATYIHNNAKPYYRKVWIKKEIDSEGDHKFTITGKRWLFGPTEPIAWALYTNGTIWIAVESNTGYVPAFQAVRIYLIPVEQSYYIREDYGDKRYRIGLNHLDQIGGR
jgi:hypothetical protein